MAFVTPMVDLGRASHWLGQQLVDASAPWKTSWAREDAYHLVI